MLLFHPALEKGYLNTIAKRGLSVAEWMIFAFSILFVLYSVNAFLKSRSREFGILTIQGIAPGQLRKLITAENIIIGVSRSLQGSSAVWFCKNIFYDRRLYSGNGRFAIVSALESAGSHSRLLSHAVYFAVAIYGFVY
jgi:ABC-type antimicrobial peptide transport system permease subunit